MAKPYRLKQPFYDDVCQHLKTLDVKDKLDTTERLIALSVHEQNDAKSAGNFISVAVSAVATIVATLAFIFSNDFSRQGINAPDWLVPVLLFAIYMVVALVIIQALIYRHKNKNLSSMEAALAIVQHRRDAEPVSDGKASRRNDKIRGQLKRFESRMLTRIVADESLHDESNPSSQEKLIIRSVHKRSF